MSIQNSEHPSPPIIDPEALRKLAEAVTQMVKALSQMMEVFAEVWQTDIVPWLESINEGKPFDTSDPQSLADALEKLSALAWDMRDYDRKYPKKKHRTPYKRSYKPRLVDKRSRVHHCRNNC